MAEILDGRRPEIIEEAANLIRLGYLIAFPTDTLYGVGADVSNPDAIDRLYAAKNRTRDKGIPVLLASKNDVDNIAQDIAASASALMDKYWPGPLTLILRKRAGLAAELSPNPGIAVRVPGKQSPPPAPTNLVPNRRLRRKRLALPLAIRLQQSSMEERSSLASLRRLSTSPAAPHDLLDQVQSQPAT